MPTHQMSSHLLKGHGGFIRGHHSVPLSRWLRFSPRFGMSQLRCEGSNSLPWTSTLLIGHDAFARFGLGKNPLDLSQIRVFIEPPKRESTRRAHYPCFCRATANVWDKKPYGLYNYMESPPFGLQFPLDGVGFLCTKHCLLVVGYMFC